MFLRCKVRRKDGKQHRYWSVVENTRTARGRVVQRHVLYLGEINDTPLASVPRACHGSAEEAGDRHDRRPTDKPMVRGAASNPGSGTGWNATCSGPLAPPPTSKGGGMLENAQAIADDSTTQKWPSSQDITITLDVSGESRTLVRKSVSASKPI